MDIKKKGGRNSNPHVFAAGWCQPMPQYLLHVVCGGESRVEKILKRK